MGLFRLWWVPRGMAADQGTYVRYRHEAMVGVLAGEAARAGALAIGEDLGTVEQWIRDYLAARRVLGTSMLWFERLADGTPLPPRPVAPRLPGHGRHARRPARGRVRHRRARGAAGPGSACSPGPWTPSASRPPRPWPPGGTRSPGRGCSSRAPHPARRSSSGRCTPISPAPRPPCSGVSLADAVGDRRPQNLPGTTDEYPNWRVPLCDGDGDGRYCSKTSPRTRAYGNWPAWWRGIRADRLASPGRPGPDRRA